MKIKDILTEETDPSMVPPDKNEDIRRLIRKGAKRFRAPEPEGALWANARQLVDAAYKTAKVEEPDISMDAAWKQFEDNIEFAVKQLWNRSKKLVDLGMDPEEAFSWRSGQLWTVDGKND